MVSDDIIPKTSRAGLPLGPQRLTLCHRPLYTPLGTTAVRFSGPPASLEMMSSLLYTHDAPGEEAGDTR